MEGVTASVVLVAAATSAEVAISMTPRAVWLAAPTEITGAVTGPETRTGAVPVTLVTPPPPPPPPVTQISPLAQIESPELDVMAAG